MRLKSWLMGLIVLALIFGGIGLTMSFNLWQTKGSKTPVKFSTGEFAGEYNPADIRGSYSFGDISELFDIPLVDIGNAFGLEDVEDLAAFKNKDLEKAYAGLEGGVEIGADTMRVFVALYKNLPYSLADTTYLPQSAVEILKNKASLTEDQIAFLESHSLDVGGVDTSMLNTVTEDSAAEATHEETTERIVKGKTTFQDLIDWGIPGEGIEAVIGGTLPATGTTVRDYAFAKGMEFSTMKSELQAKVDALGVR